MADIMKRHTNISPVNKPRRNRMRDRNFGARGAAVRAMTCLVASKHWDDQAGISDTIKALIDDEVPLAELACSGDVQAAHIDGARGLGGCNADRRKIGPLCANHHERSGERGSEDRAAFEKRFELDLEAEALRIALELDEAGLP